MDESQSQQPYTGLPLDYHNPLLTSYGVDNRVGLAKELDPNHSLIDTIHMLRGELKDPKTGQYKKQLQRVMNEQGIAIFVSQVKAGANNVNTQSNYRADDKLIYKLMNKWILDLVYIFYYERKKFVEQEDEKGIIEFCLIKDEAVVSLIINLAVGLMLPAFFKALGAGDRSAITRTVSEMINKAYKDEQEQPIAKRRGLLSKVNPFN